MKMSLKKDCKERIIAFLFIGLMIFTMGYFISLIIIPFLSSEIENLSLQIYINDDSDFENYDFLGSGTQADPYLIENYTYQEHGLRKIYISGVSKHFIVRNNIIASRRYDEGIHISAAPDNVSIINNTIFGTVYSHDGESGIDVYNLNNCNIINNSVFSKRKGIRILYCNSCSINNNVLKNGRNIEILWSSNICVGNNSLTYDELQNAWTSQNSIFIEDSYNISLVQNKLIKSWIHFDDNSINSAELKENSIDGKVIAFYKNETDFIINPLEDYGQIILANCSNGNIYDLNISISNIGISIYHSEFINCTSCKFTSNIYSGIYLYDVENMTISDSLFLRNHIGIRVKYSNSVLFMNNTFQENSYGIYISNSGCSYVNNTFINNKYDDIRTYDY